MPANLNRRSFAVTAAPGAAGNFAVGTAVTSMLSLDSSHNGQTIPTVLALDGTAWEVRTGCVYTHATLTLTRGTLESSSTGSAITLSASAIVTVTMSATVQDSVSGAGNPAAATYDGSNRVTGFAINSVTFTVTGWGTSSIVVAGSDGSTKTITLDGSGRFLAAA